VRGNQPNRQPTKTMKHIIALLLLAPTIASASIGSTESECVAKYGANLGGVNSDYEVYSSYRSGITVKALLSQGKVVKISYAGNITSKGGRFLLKMNGEKWTKVNGKWTCEGAVANISEGIITITNAGYTPPKREYTRPVRRSIPLTPYTRLPLYMIGGGGGGGGFSSKKKEGRRELTINSLKK